MDDIFKLRKIYALKNVYRSGSVGERKESSAEHSWSCMIIADYFLTKSRIKIDRLKVYELLMYHDLVEIYAGDSPLYLDIAGKKQSEKELAAMNILKDELPKTLGEKFVKLFLEFEDNKTKEARFAKAIDKLDIEIHEMDYKKDWIGWTEEYLRKKKEPYFKDFPELLKVFNATVDYCKKNGYFNQEKR